MTCLGCWDRLLIDALAESLEQLGLDYSRAMSFMSDTMNVMKGARSGVQKLLRNENLSAGYLLSCGFNSQRWNGSATC